MDYSDEVQGKRLHDRFDKDIMTTLARCVWVPCPVIIGAGPSGLAVAACLREKGIPSLILEKANCIASMWKLKTYDRLRLHLPKQFCELPFMPFPAYFPTYPTKNQFMAYLESYKNRFGLDPVFNKTVVSAEFDDQCGYWRIKTLGLKQEETEYVSQWLVVATGENADEVVPQIEGMDDFGGPIMHTSSYKSGRLFRGKDVLVVHVLPQEMLGKSTFGLSMWLLKWFPVSLVDRFLLLASRFILGDTGKLGIRRPKLGPLELKSRCGKTPVLDVGTLAKIKNGDIKVYPGIKRITRRAVEFVDGRKEDFDAIILATGFKSNVPQWLKEGDLFSEEDRMPREAFPRGWKGERGLYAVGFTKRGLLGASFDAKMIAEDIELQWKPETTNLLPYIQPLPII
ncbi:hypothetical protein V6N12_071957 [Hibiscus sabdariffa]|uniref:indole-3-pyruvate monooxygenase n=1 Tax=Hibiscus sabdariffa TaxID=183260 RepID=A0ABR2FL95_9ROSI